MNPLAPLLKGALDLVFAPSCVACNGAVPTRSSDRGICAACWTRVRELPRPRCDRCWTPLPISAGGISPSCRECDEIRPALRSIRSAFLLEGTVRAIVHGLKYRGWHSLAEPMARRMAAVEWTREVREEVRLIVPVPLAPARLRQRGYNQAELLAIETGRIIQCDTDPEVLLRTRSAGSQTTLHPGERRANVAGAFRVAPEKQERIAAEHLLLLDDVWTTGATALACAETLLNAGARAVSVLTFARALPDLERHERRLESALIS